VIKINLLSARREKKKGGIQKELLILILCVAVLGAGLGVLHWKMAKIRDEKVAQITVTRNEIAYHKSLTTEVTKAKEAQKTLQEKLNVINSLRKQKSGPARVMDELSLQKPDRVHFESLRKDGLRLGIDGIALDDETIAGFMTNLRGSKLFRNVDLIVSEQVEQRKLKLKKFTLSCEILL
jgi:type IV pilus assembly protein PilN